MIPVNSALTKYARIGLENSEKRAITSGLFFNGSIVEESRDREKSIKPRKKTGFPIIFALLPPISPIKKPMMMNKDAKTVIN